MQQSSFQVASRAKQLDFKQVIRILISLALLLALVGVVAFGTKANRVAADEAAGPIAAGGAALATPYSSEFSNGMPLP